MNIRLNKFISESGYCSRRKADELIKAGKVKVNSNVITELGYKVDTEVDKVYIDGTLINPKKDKVYIKLYKPRGYLTALGRDKFGKKTLSDLFQEIGLRDRVFPAGRLDFDSEGLLILTNDGYFANLLTHPKYNVSKVYKVMLEGVIDKDKLEDMKRGTVLEDGFFKPDEIKIVSLGRNKTWVEVTIHSGKKRILRRFFKSFGHKVLRLIRVKIDGISIDDLKPGEFDYIPKSYIERLIKYGERG